MQIACSINKMTFSVQCDNVQLMKIFIHHTAENKIYNYKQITDKKIKKQQ